MGIYPSGDIYGIAWNIYDASGDFVSRYERFYKTKMTEAQIREVRIEWRDRVPETVKRDAGIQIYTPCTTSYDVKSSAKEFMIWWTYSRDQLEALFLDTVCCIGDIVLDSKDVDLRKAEK